MKKLMIAVAAVACATVGLADDITSANTVGYTGKQAEQGKFMILGPQFEHPGTESTSINGLITGLEGISTETADFTTLAPQIQLPNAQGGYTPYYYGSDVWHMIDPAGDPEDLDNWECGSFWCEGDGTYAEVEFTPGEAVWVRSIQSSSDANVAGQVPGGISDSIDCPQGFAIRANIFPKAITLNDDNMTVSGLEGVSTEDPNFTTLAPQIQVVNAQGGYTPYYYGSDVWHMIDPAGDPEDVDNWECGKAWCEGDGTYLSDVTIPVAQGFWTKGVQNSFTLEFKGVQ